MQKSGGILEENNLKFNFASQIVHEHMERKWSLFIGRAPFWRSRKLQLSIYELYTLFYKNRVIFISVSNCCVPDD